MDNKKYFVEDILEAEFNLEPLICKFCERNNVIFHQYIGDGYCECCGRWQLEEGEK